MQKVLLEIDHRELSPGKENILASYADYFDIRFTHLPVGDYVINNNIIIERKTLTDFVASIKEGRIFRQAYSIAGLKKHAVFILEGRSYTLADSNMKREAIMGVLIHLSVVLGIPVIRSIDLNETLYLIKSIARQTNNKSDINKVYTLPKKSKRSGVTNKQKIKLLQMIPGLGTEKSVALLEKFGSIKKIALAKPSKLTEVKGIGKKLAENISAVLQ